MKSSCTKTRLRDRGRHWLPALAILLVPASEVPGAEAPPRIRQPVALAIADAGKTLLVANRRSGSLSVIDALTYKLIAEHNIGRGLADLALVPNSHSALVVDQTANEILLLDGHDRWNRVIGRMTVPFDPVRLAVSADGSTMIVASRWSRRITCVELAKHASGDPVPSLSISGGVDLPFCPQELALFADGARAIVADAFGGRLAVINLKTPTVESVRSLPAHNIRGLTFAPDGQSLILAHQVLNRNAQTTFDDVHWGLLIRNHLRILPTSTLLNSRSDAELLNHSRLIDVGDVGYAAGDPADVSYDVRGNLLIALAGVGEVAITASPEQGPRRVAVGRRPSAIATSPDGRVAFVADALDDTISVVEIATGMRPATIALGPKPPLTAADRGERLFYSAKLSHDGWMSCHSCHSDGHTNNLVSDTLGDSSYGAPKRVPSLLGVAATAPWTWTGSMNRLEDQVRKSITSTMQGTKPTDDQVADLTAYLNSLALPARDVFKDTPPSASSASVDRGSTIFNRSKCASCHIPPELTSPGRFDVGLVDEVGNREFNPPSLRGLRDRDAFLHDGRTHAIEEVFQRERHPRGLTLSAPEIADLVAFLKTL